MFPNFFSSLIFKYSIGTVCFSHLKFCLRGWEYSLGIECLPSICKAWGSIPYTAKKQNKINKLLLEPN
jgi:hypothetical protein